jgi:hypothetical protein
VDGVDRHNVPCYYYESKNKPTKEEVNIMKIKTILTAIFVALFTTATIADEVLVILAGGKSGKSAQRNAIYAEVLKEQGYNVNLTKHMQNDLAIEMYNNAKGPATLVWIDLLAGKFDVDYTENEFMGIEYSVPLFMCEVNSNTKKNKGITGIQRNAPPKAIKALGYKNLVPYPKQKDVLNAALAGEVDYAYVGLNGKGKLNELGKSCEQIPALYHNAYTIAKNVDVAEFRKSIRAVIESPQMKKWQEGRGYTNSQATWNYNNDYSYIREAMSVWADARK